MAQPAFAVQLLYNNGERQELCYMSLRLCFCAGVILCGVSMTTLAALSVDRLLALLLTLRYRQIVTTARVRAVLGSFWITSAFVSTTYFWNDNVTTIIGCTAPFICLSISALSYAKMCQSLRRRHVQIACKDKNIPITEYSTLQEDSVYSDIHSAVLCSLLPSVRYRYNCVGCEWIKTIFGTTLGIELLPSLDQFVHKSVSLHLEDQGCTTSSEEHNQME